MSLLPGRDGDRDAGLTSPDPSDRPDADPERTGAWEPSDYRPRADASESDAPRPDLDDQLAEVPDDDEDYTS